MLRYAAIVLLSLSAALPLAAQQPPGVIDAMAGLSNQPATRISFSLDRSMLQAAQGLFGAASASSLGSVSVDTYHFAQPAFYTPEAFAALVENYNTAGWKHLVNGRVSPGANAQPTGQLTDLWLHYVGADIQDVTVLLRSSHQMNVIQVSGSIRPLDLLHLAGHFGIPRVDPNAVMVPAAPGR